MFTYVYFFVHLLIYYLFTDSFIDFVSFTRCFEVPKASDLSFCSGSELFCGLSVFSICTCMSL